MGTSSVVSVEVVQASRTCSPTRSTRRSLTGEGRWSDGGLGGPGFAQPASPETAAVQNRPAVRSRVIEILGWISGWE